MTDAIAVACVTFVVLGVGFNLGEWWTYRTLNRRATR